ncbi:ribonuclease III domain-containing protein [Dioszegia hungarica]|uniref:Large ribosomal subunit protein mL44 n=1 Tax=Dioszegia hungarica TaxID=4972 RepID=A0AA38LTW6_9TREE|nr:ribonuclease III domain-containing protein [Dioszegia hungarica]KAI9635143.1 ribonuclease III domain-containing protein [Dioszegia hungarica]
MPFFNPSSLPLPLLRQIARSRSSPRFRRALSTSPVPLEARRPLPLSPLAPSIPPTPTLSALASRLSLPQSSTLHPGLVACLTHPSFSRTSAASGSTSTASTETDTNELLSTLGNSLLGLFASEHLAQRYPFLPTEALKAGVTAYVGPAACFAIARELGVGVHGPGDGLEKELPEGQRRRGHGAGGRPASEGVGVRWIREVGFEKVPVARRFRGRMEREGGGGAGPGDAIQRREGWEEVVAGVVKAFVGLIYQEQGMTAARQFTHAHFLSRYLDMTSLFNFTNPKHVLSRAVAKHLSDAGVEPTAGEGNIESRLLAQTGTNSQSPLFNIGLFLPSGLKLSEGYGSSLKMAEHRAAVNALHALFLVRGDTEEGGGGLGGMWRRSQGEKRAGGLRLPTESHGVWAVEGGKVGKGLEFQGSGWGGGEVTVESRKRVTV